MVSAYCLGLFGLGMQLSSRFCEVPDEKSDKISRFFDFFGRKSEYVSPPPVKKGRMRETIRLQFRIVLGIWVRMSTGWLL